MSSTTWSPRLWALLLMLSGNMLMDALEVSTIVIAMPSIRAEFHLTPAATSWLMTGFALGFAGFIVLGGRMTARYGRRRIYLNALLVFSIASVASGLSGDVYLLTAARVIKGVCVALTAPTGLAIIASTFDEGPPRNRALSVYSLFGASGLSAGLLLSGWLSLISWRWALAFSGLVAFVLYMAGRRYIPFDLGRRQTGSRATKTSGETPVPARILTHGPLLRSAAGAATLNGSYWGFLLLATFQMQSTWGWSSLATGLALLPTSLPLALSVMFGGRMVGRFGPGRLIAVGSVAALVGYAWYLHADGHQTYLADVAPTVALVGVGFMLSFLALHIQAITGASPSRQALIGGVYQTSVQLGGAVTLMLVVLGTGLRHRPASIVVTAVAAAGALIAVVGVVTDRHKARRGEPQPRRDKQLRGEPCPPIRSESRSL